MTRKNHLHSDYSIDEEEHGYQECHVGKSLVGEKEKERLYFHPSARPYIVIFTAIFSY